MKRLRLQTGSNIVEFALVLPLLLVLVFGIIDFSVLLFDKAVITNAAREGARNGVVFRNTRLGDAEIEAVVNNYCGSFLITFGNRNFRTTITRRDEDSDTIDDGSGDTLTVRVDYDYTFTVTSKLVPLGDSVRLSSTSVMRYE
jgi:Flp pilus assembly protein TadG